MFYGAFAGFGLMLTVAGWLMINENIGDLRRGEGMYNATSRKEAAWSATLMAIVGLALLLAGVTIMSYMVTGLFH
jgi:hypothetical protein